VADGTLTRVKSPQSDAAYDCRTDHICTAWMPIGSRTGTARVTFAAHVYEC
jgi:hypothetical protein